MQRYAAHFLAYNLWHHLGYYVLERLNFEYLGSGGIGGQYLYSLPFSGTCAWLLFWLSLTSA